jgi:glutaredoxin 3
MSKIEIYTSNDCHFCHEAKDYFKSNNLEFTEHNVSNDVNARKFLMKKGVMSVPFIIIDDNELIGFDKSKVEAIVKF